MHSIVRTSPISRHTTAMLRQFRPARRWFSAAAADPSTATVAARLASQFTPATLAHLQRYGFAIVDHALASSSDTSSRGGAAGAAAAASADDGRGDRSPPSSSPLADGVRARILALHDQPGLMTLNHTHLVHKRTNRTKEQPQAQGQASAPADLNRTMVSKHSIYEADFATQAHLLEGASEAARFWSDFVRNPIGVQALNRYFAPPPQPPSKEEHAASSLASELTFEKQTVKAQVSRGEGGCFPLHFDTDRRVDSRRLTAILYLNPEWSMADDGGALRLYPFPHGPPIDVAPVHDRLVLFDSTRMLHRVMPSRRQRVCVTIWYWQAEQQWRASLQQQQTRPTTPPSEFVRQRDAALAQLFPDASPAQLTTLTHLLSPAYIPHLSRLFHTHEWFTSLEESHPEGSVALQEMLVNHLDEADMIARALGGPLSMFQYRDSAAKGAAARQDQDDTETWRSWLPIPYTVPPTLPAYCAFVPQKQKQQQQSAATPAPPTSSHGESSSAAAAAAVVAPSTPPATAARLIDWMGSE